MTFGLHSLVHSGVFPHGQDWSGTSTIFLCMSLSGSVHCQDQALQHIVCLGQFLHSIQLMTAHICVTAVSPITGSQAAMSRTLCCTLGMEGYISRRQPGGVKWKGRRVGDKSLKSSWEWRERGKGRKETESLGLEKNSDLQRWVKLSRKEQTSLDVSLLVSGLTSSQCPDGDQ